jgi:presequence protease
VTSSVQLPPVFTLVQRREIATLNLTMLEYEHVATGARHLHLATDHKENVFMVALRTVPSDSTGVAHILEHTALCGSERFPVRDPFFLMLRRSLNTFMNAFTTSDYTAYPFASSNRKDFFNLLDVYLDAVFFSRLDPLDFAQEGHRLEFEEPGNSHSQLVYKGVVYNEMKGAMSSPVSVLWDFLQKHLFPSVTYHYNSGGNPSDIPSLTYPELLEFYQTHYHPTNAVFMTFGDIDVDTLHAIFEERALSRFERRDTVIEVPPEKRMSAPIEVLERYAVDSQQTEHKTHIIIAWLLGTNTNLENLLRANLLSDALLDTSASPLRQALESFAHSAAVSPLTGLEESNHEMSFVCGVEGSDAEHAEALQAVILGVLQQVAETGIARDRLEAVLHQIELSQREIGGDGMPYGLQLVFSCMSAAVHRGSPMDLLDLDHALENLRKDIQDPEFIKNLVRDLLLNNSHRVRLSMVADPHLSQQQDDQERQRLDEIKEGLTESQRQFILKQSHQLTERQAHEEDLSVLPSVTLADIPEAVTYPEPLGSKTITRYGASCNGLVYHQIVTELGGLEDAQWQVLPLLGQLIGELGSGGRDYLATQVVQHAITGGLSAYSSLRNCLDDRHQQRAFFVLGSRALQRNAVPMVDLLKQTLETVRFDELDRMTELVRQILARREMGVTGQGHSLAMLAASAWFSPVAALNHRLSGLAGLEHLKSLDLALQKSGSADLAGQLQGLHELLLNSAKVPLLISDADISASLHDVLLQRWENRPELKGSRIRLVGGSTSPDTVYLTNTQVNFCAQAYAAVPVSDADSAALSVLASVFGNHYLHNEIREKGGAYGGGANFDANSGVFRLYSYRDPELERTYEVFDKAVAWARQGQSGSTAVEEAILGIVSALDAPGSPAGEARQSFHLALHGRNAGWRQAQRRQILMITADDVQRVAEHYLQGQIARSVVTGVTENNRFISEFECHRL